MDQLTFAWEGAIFDPKEQLPISALSFIPCILESILPMGSGHQEITRQHDRPSCKPRPSTLIGLPFSSLGTHCTRAGKMSVDLFKSAPSLPLFPFFSPLPLLSPLHPPHPLSPLQPHVIPRQPEAF